MEAELRLVAFVVALLVMALWEVISPRRKEDQKRKTRWPVNLGLVVFNSLLVRVTVGGIVFQYASIAAEKNYGLLNWFDVSGVYAVILTLIFLDLVIYGQHVVSHKVPLIWKLHQVHHTDLIYDTTTGVRFHPLEIFFSLIVKVITVFIIGADPMAVILFEVILNTSAVFNHGNVNIPVSVDRVLRKVIVTPDMHRVHHSIYRDEHDTNFGFSVSIWDRLFRTYTDQPREGHDQMKIGLSYAREPEAGKFQRVLMLPFHSIR